MEELNSIDSFIKDHSVAVVTFHADWCAPCKSMLKILQQAESQYPSISFGVMEIDKSSSVLSSIGITAIPLLIVSKDGEIVEKRLGSHSKSDLIDLLENYEE